MNPFDSVQRKFLDKTYIHPADTPANGEVPIYDSASGTVLWGPQSGGGGGSTAYDFGTFSSPVTFTLDMGTF